MPTNFAGIYTNLNSRMPWTAPPAKSECCCPACSGLECLDRTRFFAGQLLTESDLNNEQSYWLAKNRLHNRYLHGWGVVCGLQVVCAECDGWVTIRTGYALDPCGNDIIVCKDYPFNVIDAIKACCAPPKATNCSPLRYTPSPTCQDAIQTWCVTIEYQEQPTRMITPLRQAPSKGEACRCADPCETTPSSPSAQPCGCNSKQPQTPPSNNGACEPTRIAEGFKICVVPAPESDDNQDAPRPGTVDYQKALCLDALQQVLATAPTITQNTPPGTAYQAVCKYLATVRNALSKANVTRCQIESRLITIQVPAPDNTDNYLDKLSAIVDTLSQIVRAAAFDCMCMALVPSCPPEPCDDRVILACVTVQGDKIINICHFGARRQVFTFPVLYYWLSAFGFDKVLGQISDWLQLLCCGSGDSRYKLFGPSMLSHQTLSTDMMTNPAMVNHFMAQALSQKLGATLINAADPTAQAVDLRPYLGQNLEAMRAAMTRNYNFQNVTVKDVTNDPAWSDQTVAAAANFAPPTFSLTQPLTVYVAGPEKQVVGFDTTNPLHALQEQLTQVHTRLDTLTKHMAAAPAAGAAPAKTKKRKGTP